MQETAGEQQCQKKRNSAGVQLKAGQKSLGFSSNGGLVSNGQRGLHSPGLQPNQANKSIILQPGSPYRLGLTLHVSKQSVYQQEYSSPLPCSAAPTGHGYRSVCHGGRVNTYCKSTTQGAATLTKPIIQQQHTGVFGIPDA